MLEAAWEIGPGRLTCEPGQARKGAAVVRSYRVGCPVFHLLGFGGTKSAGLEKCPPRGLFQNMRAVGGQNSRDG